MARDSSGRLCNMRSELVGARANAFVRWNSAAGTEIGRSRKLCLHNWSRTGRGRTDRHGVDWTTTMESVVRRRSVERSHLARRGRRNGSSDAESNEGIGLR